MRIYEDVAYEFMVAKQSINVQTVEALGKQVGVEAALRR